MNSSLHHLGTAFRQPSRPEAATVSEPLVASTACHPVAMTVPYLEFLVCVLSLSTKDRLSRFTALPTESHGLGSLSVLSTTSSTGLHDPVSRSSLCRIRLRGNTSLWGFSPALILGFQRSCTCLAPGLSRGRSSYVLVFPTTCGLLVCLLRTGVNFHDDRRPAADDEWESYAASQASMTTSPIFVLGDDAWQLWEPHVVRLFGEAHDRSNTSMLETAVSEGSVQNPDAMCHGARRFATQRTR